MLFFQLHRKPFKHNWLYLGHSPDSTYKAKIQLIFTYAINCIPEYLITNMFQFTSFCCNTLRHFCWHKSVESEKKCQTRKSSNLKQEGNAKARSLWLLGNHLPPLASPNWDVFLTVSKSSVICDSFQCENFLYLTNWTCVPQFLYLTDSAATRATHRLLAEAW